VHYSVKKEKENCLAVDTSWKVNVHWMSFSLCEKLCSRLATSAAREITAGFYVTVF